MQTLEDIKHVCTERHCIYHCVIFLLSLFLCLLSQCCNRHHVFHAFLALLDEGLCMLQFDGLNLLGNVGVVRDLIKISDLRLSDVGMSRFEPFINDLEWFPTRKRPAYCTKISSYVSQPILDLVCCWDDVCARVASSKHFLALQVHSARGTTRTHADTTESAVMPWTHLVPSERLGANATVQSFLKSAHALAIVEKSIWNRRSCVPRHAGRHHEEHVAQHASIALLRETELFLLEDL
mmetsp:Transcript_75895/g.143058  ORF Transcript_75895/g.143058 Transcript_75895/m.143058 type:complete len:237 (+) Transcript_75895:74-784(+)